MPIRHYLVPVSFLALLLLTGLAAVPAAVVASEGDRGAASLQLDELLAEAWEFRLREDPLFASNEVGDYRYNDRLPAEAPADQDRRAEARRGFLDRLAAIDRGALTPGERLDYDIFRLVIEERLAEHGFGADLMPITNRTGFHVSFPQLPKRVPLQTVKDYEDYIARLAAFRAYAGDHVELMRAGIATGMVLPRVSVEGIGEVLAPHIVADASASLLYAPFADFPDTVPAAERERLEAAGRRAIETSVVPGYRLFSDFMSGEYLPAARSEVGASALPRGEEFYAHRVRRYTTLEVTPREVHEKGLAEVARIRGEMEAVLERVGFEGELREFFRFLRDDPRFYVETPEALMKEVALVLKKMDGQLPRLFGRLPRVPYGIRPVPDFIAPRTTTAYYESPAGDGSRAGFYYVNTYDLASRPLYEVEALSLHEAVPGHHLQIALQQELEMRPFRRFASFTAFVEGWALYAERLGLEVGFYEDPYSDFGRLSYEMWRACRLVVDTGLHALGWSRQRAIDFMAENSALTLHNITTEVDRYISWPGQALGYKMGELTIRRLRAEAEEALGEKFDVRRFHDVVLGSGAVPLTVLEASVRAYLAESADSAE